MEIPLAVTGYDISIWIHITAVVVGFGATFGEALFFPVAMKMDPRHLPYVHRIQLAINRNLATPALVLIIATGIYQLVDRDWDIGAFWISATFLIVIIIGGLLGGYFIPADRRLEAMVSDEIAAAGDGPFEPSDEYLARSRTEGFVGTATGLLVIVAIYLMVVKPGA
ncbi:MAG: DUF2269 family protein [Solirubrobacterales bacterium]|nr:DUF2269 family protein [Solirubrobacterales bacterium]